MANTVFHKSPFTQDRTEVQKGVFSFDIAFTWVFVSSKAADTLPDKSGIYTQRPTLTVAQVPLCSYWQVLVAAVDCRASSLLQDDLGFMGISGVLLCRTLGVLQVCTLCSFHPGVVDPGSDTCNLVAVVRTTVYGLFQCGVKEACFHFLTHT